MREDANGTRIKEVSLKNDVIGSVGSLCESVKKMKKLILFIYFKMED